MLTNLNRPSEAIAAFVSGLGAADIPENVMMRAEELFLDWSGSAVVGSIMAPVPLFLDFARRMGPADGPCELLGSRPGTSAWFAAFANGAASHVAEQDDVHNGSVFHPAAVVFPAVLAVAQERGCSGQEMLVAGIAGYEIGIRVGEFLGRSHYRLFHTTGTAGTIAAAVAVGKLIGLGEETLVNAIGSAGTQAAGLWEFLRDAADSKQLHTAKAAADGLLSAYMAETGLTGARRILEGEQGLGAGMSHDADPARITERLGKRWATVETSFKLHASCRHTHPAADALLAVIAREHLAHSQIATIEARVHQAAIDVLGRVAVPQSVHQAKFSMGAMLGLIAVHGRAGLDEFDRYALTDPDVARIRQATRMIVDSEVEAAYPARWLGRVTVVTTDGRTLAGSIDEPKGDPGNTLSRIEIENKVRALATRAVDASAVEEMIARIGRLRSVATVGRLL